MPFLDEDLLTVKLAKGSIVLAFGDPIEIIGSLADESVKVRLQDGTEGSAKEFKTRDTGVFQFSLVDVQQGDGMVLESPSGKVVLIDGGDNQLFARYVAARFRSRAGGKGFPVEAILVTHGDADHFEGLTEFTKGESTKKGLRLLPKRIYHNGIVKAKKPASGEEQRAIFGDHLEDGNGVSWITQLEDDLLGVDDSRMNTPFRAWKKSIAHWDDKAVAAGQPNIVSKRLDAGMTGMFDFFDEDGVAVEILGPAVTEVKLEDGSEVPALPWLHEPSKSASVGVTASLSASHTINGHSVTLRITVGNVRFLLGGDLNAESMDAMLATTPIEKLEAEIVKVPHHGSADFSFEAIKAMKPFVWLISSGDESAQKDHIHPRADLMGALGAASRTGLRPLIFCTELAAFFEMRGPSKTDKLDKDGQPKSFFGFERTNFGIVHVRTDGERVFVFTHSGDADKKEAYAYKVDKNHKVKAAAVRKK